MERYASLLRLLVIFLLTLSPFAPNATGEDSITFLRFRGADGQVPSDLIGTFKPYGLGNYHEVLSYSWELNNPTFSLDKTGVKTVTDFKITSYVDPATPAILSYCYNGTMIAKAELQSNTPSTVPAQKGLFIYLENVYITSVSAGVSIANGRPTQTIALSCDKIRIRSVVEPGEFVGRESESELILRESTP